MVTYIYIVHNHTTAKYYLKTATYRSVQHAGLLQLTVQMCASKHEQCKTEWKPRPYDPQPSPHIQPRSNIPLVCMLWPIDGEAECSNN
jgi:hypothetical protein